MMRSQGNDNVNQHNGQPPSTAATTTTVIKNQEPSRHEIRPGRDGMSPVPAQWTALQPSAVAVSRGFSDPSLAVVQPASNSHNSNSSNGSVVVGCGGPKSSQLFHSHHYHARRQRDRQQQSVNSNCNSRSSSAADLSLLQSSTVNLSNSLGNQHGSASSSSLNNVNHIKDSSSGGGGGISSIWARWFRRNNNNNNHRPSSSSVRPFSSAAVYGGGGGGGGAAGSSRSHSVENSPVVSRRLRHHPSMMTGSSGQLASSDNNSDSLSTNSFSFIRTPTDKNNDPAAVAALTLRRKYGLMACSNESTDKVLPGSNNLDNNIEGDAIRAMRTQWETQMKQMDEILRSREEQPDNNNTKCNNNKRLSQANNNNNSTARKKRPAPQPPPPPPPNSGTSSRHSTHNRSSSSVASGSGFTHVPGKRKAPSPPDSATTTNTNTNTFNIVAPPHPVLPDLMESTPPEASPPLAENNKWSNDLNCNLLLDENNQVRSSSKVLRYQQNKFDNNDCPHNDILKLEGGVLRPLDSSTSNKQQQAEASGSTLDYPTHRGNNMMTLPLKPWYKRGRNQHGGSNGIISGNQLHHHHSSANAASRSKWKDAAILHHSPPPVLPALPAATDECNSWAMGLVANHQLLLHPPESNTMRSNHSSTGVSPGGSTRSEASGSSVCSSDGSKGKQQQQQQHHRKSLLVNISQLDREANEIIQRERARESQRRRLEDDKFYSHSNGQLLAVPPPPPPTTTTHLSLPTVADVPDDESPPLLPPRDPAPPVPPPPGDVHQPQLAKKCARELIHMFNSLTDSSPPSAAAAATSVPSASSINSPASATTKQTTTAELPRLEQPQRADANYSQTGHTYNGQVDSNKESPPPGCSAGTTGTVNVPTADRQVRTTTTTSPPTTASSSRLLQTSDESTSIKAVNTNTITRLRVTVPAGSPELAQQQQQQQQQSIFNPKLEVAAAAGSGGGARPKHSPSVSCPADDKSPLVNGYSKQPQPQPPQQQLNKTTTTTGGWACQVCTLVNSDARLWCEACTALKPRQLAGRTSSTTINAAGPAVVKETVKLIPAVVQTPEVITTSPTPSTTTTPSLLSNSGNNSTVVVATTPSSPEALRQARLAFFLNGQHNNNNINNKPEAIKKDEQKGDDKNNNNNNKRHSQHGGIKVSSGCQTQPFVQLPSQIGSSSTSGVNGRQQRPVSMLAKSCSSPSVKNNISIIPPPVDSGPSVNSLCNTKRVVLAPAVLKDVHPTNFALVSPSRTQLSQYLQQQQQQQQQAGKGSGGQQPAPGESGPNDVQDNKSTGI
ncbi:hypothetical protein DAPPUDRAFT_246385 [Daphnia pulex]|uniref:RanBP2-type domain-containing protein n=1 Tax=Daphnia pulex TaxID=6669 RepID=E9GQC8_DAPPU|nr:hypothetical protein DAPPUDRAFT_246385 [Daphnia pulex]|eukprot:EFX78366.1 hypothetical protein DAPPUDRAFT_246385 [Daphnia pulex]